MPSRPSLHRPLAVLAGLVAAMLLCFGFGTSLVEAHGRPARPKPTIVLVHGAFADASSWSLVATALMREGYPVIAPANPLHGVKSDSDYIASVLASITGPIVLVGHSYGGVVITNAAVGNPNVKALVYIAAFAPDQGESLASIGAQFPDSDLGASILQRATPGGVDLYIQSNAFRQVFAADLPRVVTTTMAAGQRPLGVDGFTETSGVPAWATIPSWFMVAGNDRAIDPAAERFMAGRAHAHTTEIRSSHVAMLSHPAAVVAMIDDAVRSTD